jgi:hypothetical protein
MHGKALGAALAACAALALTACATAQPSAAHQQQTSPSGAAASVAADHAVSASQETLKQRAEAAAAALLRSFAVPPGGHRLAGPPDLAGGVLKTPLSYLGAAWEVDVSAFWEAPGNPQALLAWEQAHLGSGFKLGDEDFGPPAWDRDFQLAPKGALIVRDLNVEMASAGGGQSGIRLDAWVAWQPPRTAGSRISAAATTVTIAESSDGVIQGRAAKPLPAPVTITDQATVRRLAALIDGLPLSTLAADDSCPPPLGRFLTLTFRARPGGPALASVETNQSCNAVVLTLGGRQQPSLENEPTLNGQILSLAGLSWKLS